MLSKAVDILNPASICFRNLLIYLSLCFQDNQLVWFILKNQLKMGFWSDFVCFVTSLFGGCSRKYTGTYVCIEVIKWCALRIPPLFYILQNIGGIRKT